MSIRLAPLAFAFLLAPLASGAQTTLDPTADPRQGTLQASSSASDVLDIQIAPEAANPLENCPGFFTLGAPDATVDWDGGESALRVWVRSAADAVLIVRAPTGQTRCEDDTEGVQPAIEFDQALPGRYAVWVGSFGSDLNTSPAATLYAGPPPPPASLAPGADAPLLAIDESDVIMDAEPHADHATESLGLPAICPGFIGAEPTARVSGDGLYYLTASSDADLVMAVRTASGDWLCDDDSGPDTDPAIEISASGEHTVWVGTFRGHARGDAPEASLMVTRDSPEDFGVSLPPPPEPFTGDFEPNYFSEATYVPLDLTSRGMEMTLEASDDMAELEMDVHGENSNPATGNACSGAVSPMASATLAFEGDGPLTLTATAQDDLVLLVRTASGDWFCSDDASGRDPAIEIEEPAGDVTIWVGTFSQGSRARATLTAHRAALVDILPEDEEIYEDYEEADDSFYSEGSYLGSGLSPEAPAPTLVLDQQTTVQAGGSVFNRVMGDACAGYISEAPSATVVGSGQQISFWASGEDDLTMTLRTPNGDWFCSDDHLDTNPGIVVTDGGNGVYAIWVGTFSRSDETETARLVATEGSNDMD